MITQDQINAKWQEFKGGVRNQWGDLSVEELDETHGSLSAIRELIMSKYNESYETVNFKMKQLIDSFDNDTDKHPHDIGVSSYQRSPLVNEASNPKVKSPEELAATSPNYEKKIDKTIEKYRYLNDQSLEKKASKYNRKKLNPNLSNLSDSELDSIRKSIDSNPAIKDDHHL